ncbi:hypothetical protein CYJ57_03035 [Falseniella ignava]|uniref:Bacteriophage Gp15 protein n=1 Tax=Falseniella ignava TaxID=137730 RepID=A0A2I1K209_9LACT|nr:Gp15 family bacteriophage protein [Falseniella ignava]PKY89699.1 hypothetical protein CYJ57_03035 [Falseniella ignava]
MDISRKLVDKYVIGDKEYTLNLAFNVVLKVIELMRDDSVDEINRLFTALFLFFGEDVRGDLTLEIATESFMDIFDTYVRMENEEADVVRDIKGNIIPREIIDKSKSEEDDQPLYDISQDGEYIYSSFMQAYGIDLFDEQNKMHWHKFNALLSGLPSDTKFAEVIRIRSWKPSKGESSEYKKEMRRLQEVYRLSS